MAGDLVDAGDIISKVTGAVGSVINRIWPDKSKEELERLKADLQVQLGQLGIEKIEAGSKFWWVAGARPALIWMGGVALLYKSVIYPTMVFYGHPGPDIDVSSWVTLLLALIGARTYEKRTNTAGNH